MAIIKTMNSEKSNFHIRAISTNPSFKKIKIKIKTKRHYLIEDLPLNDNNKIFIA
jgi:hypothetical protein